MKGRRPTPERITAALDLAGLHGPEVDAALGVVEPVVDLWEEGRLVPSDAELRRLAALTGFMVDWFFRPAPEPLGGPLFICSRGRGGGCVVVDDRPVAPVESLFGQGALF